MLQINLSQMAAISLALSEKEWKHKRNTTLFYIYSPAANIISMHVVGEGPGAIPWDSAFLSLADC